MRFKPHTLGRKEERLLAMQTEMARAAGQVFRQLNDADLKFGTLKDEKGQTGRAQPRQLLDAVALARPRASAKSLPQLLPAIRRPISTRWPPRSDGSIQRDIYYARARNYPSALEAALFPDRVPVSVYDNLIASVRRHLPALHHYYDLRRRKMRLRDIHHYDTYVPILAELQTRHTWDEAVEMVLAALAPLGGEYGGVLDRGLRGRWCDRYENPANRAGPSVAAPSTAIRTSS